MKVSNPPSPSIQRRCGRKCGIDLCFSVVHTLPMETPYRCSICKGFFNRNEVLKNNKPNKCEKCEQIKIVEGHHFDYEKPLEVVWVCRKCHSLIHRSLVE